LPMFANQLRFELAGRAGARSVVRSWLAITRNLAPLSPSAYITAAADLHSRQSQPPRNSASRRAVISRWQAGRTIT
jgi:hypothetical protein